MTLPNWLRVIWWALLTLSLGLLLYERFPSITASTPTAFDALALTIFVVLALTPLFSEITLPGVTLKQRVEALQTEVKTQFEAVRHEIRTNVATNVTQQVLLPPVPPDSSLPAIKHSIQQALATAPSTPGVIPSTAPSVSGDVALLFAARNNLEREIRRLWLDRGGDESLQRKRPLLQMARDLEERGVITPALLAAARDLYNICSPAVHGESVTAAQVQFVREVSPGLIATLAALR